MAEKTVPVSVRIHLPALKASEWTGVRPQSLSDRYRFRSCAGKPGDLLIGETPVCAVAVDETGEGFILDAKNTDRLSSVVEKSRTVLKNARTRFSLRAGTARLNPSELGSLRKGSVITLSETETDPVDLVEDMSGFVRAAGECVEYSSLSEGCGCFGVRILDAKPEREHPSGGGRALVSAEVLLGGCTLSQADIDALGEGSIVAGDHPIMLPVPLVIDGKTVAWGRVSVRTGKKVFIVEEAPFSRISRERGPKPQAKPASRTEPAPEKGLSAETERAIYDALGKIPLSSLRGILLSCGKHAAPYLLKILDPERCAQVLPSAADAYGEGFLSDYIACDPDAAFSEAAHAALSHVAEGILELMARGDMGERAAPAEKAAQSFAKLSAAELKPLLDRLSKEDPETYTALKPLLPTLEDVARLSDRDVQKLLKEVDAQEVAWALLGAEEALRGIFFRNMSSRAVDMLKDDMKILDANNKARQSQAEEQIMYIFRVLVQNGEIFL
jgi:flagellar motor switch/type III secretory pathway protein FliN